MTELEKYKKAFDFAIDTLTDPPLTYDAWCPPWEGKSPCNKYYSKEKDDEGYKALDCKQCFRDYIMKEVEKEND